MTALRVTNSDEFRLAVAAYDDDVRERVAYDFGPNKANAQLADALDGLALTPAQWQLMLWFLSWDSQDTLAEIITTARASGPARIPS